MLRALGFRSSSPALNQDEITKKIINQALELEKALKAMDYVLDDRSIEAFKLLDDHDNIAISELAYGVVQFLEATLGFEAQTMRKASDTLSSAESMAWKEKTYAEKNNIKTSSIYPPGTEFAVAYAESNLLNALLMLLSENFMEGAKALLKLRRAYQTLDSISRQLKSYSVETSSSLTSLKHYPSTSSLPISNSNNNISSISINNSIDNSSNNSINNSNNNNEKIKANANPSFVDIPIPLTEQESKDKKMIDDLEKIYQMRKDRIDGRHIGNPPVSNSLRSDLGFREDNKKPIKELKFGNPDVASVDEYIHSGVNLCFGILQVVLSLIPQGIGKVLSVVGFKGSREAGLKMVWNAAQERNIHGGIALLALLVFYDGPFQFTDVDFDVPSTNELNKNNSHQLSSALAKTITNNSAKSKKDLVEEKIELERVATLGNGETFTLLHPGKKLVDTLLHARALFPHSNLWLLQESRMLASRGRLEEAVELMDTAKPSQMKQVDALLGFDRCMILVFLHRFDRAAKDFIDLIQINSYSHALYTWFAGACYLEAWRMCVTNNLSSGIEISKMNEYKALAEKYLHQAQTLIGKKKFMSKIPPFEKFIHRKYKEIQSTHSLNPNLEFLDCIGTSLIHELAYFWNGYNRMPEDHLTLAIKLLGYSADKTINQDLDLVNPTSNLPYVKLTETQEQSMIRFTLQAISLRRLGKVREGMKILDENVIKYLVVDGKITNLYENPWLYPTALYERALFCWKLNGVDGLGECMDWLKKSQAYGGDDYELSTRVTMKTKAAIDRLEDLEY